MKRCATLLSFIFCLSSLLTFASGPWNQKASLPGPGRHRPFSFVVGDRAYIGGGWDGATMWFDFWEYDPATNSWTQRANTPIVMWTAIGFGVSGKGHSINGTTNYVYDPALNMWNVGTPCPISVSWESEAWVLGNKAYIPNNSQVASFDGATNNWTIINTTGYTSAGWGTGFQTSTKFYDISGSILYELNPATWVWTPRASFPGPPRNQCCAFGVGEKGYYGCGDLAVSPWDNLNDWWQFNPATNTWMQINTLPGATRENFTAWVMNDRGYIACGTNGINHQDVWEFDGSLATGINDEENNFSVNVYPNPMSESASLEIQNSEFRIQNLKFELYDLQGQRVRNFRLQTLDLKLERGSLSAGTYLYQISSEGKPLASGKLLVQ